MACAPSRRGNSSRNLERSFIVRTSTDNCPTYPRFWDMWGSLHNPPPTTATFRLSHLTMTSALAHPPPSSEPWLRGEGLVCLASVRAQSADLKPFFEISACPHS